MGRSRLAEISQDAGNSASQINTQTTQLQQEMSADDSDDQSINAFMERVNKARAQIDSISEKLVQVKDKHEQALCAIEPKEVAKNRSEVDSLNSQIQKARNSVRAILKEIGKDLQTSGGATALDRLRSSQHAALSKKFYDIMNEYNDIQSTYKMRMRERVKRQFKIVKPDASNEEVESVLEADGQNIFSLQTYGASHIEAKQALEDVRERQKELQKLEESIKELHNLFAEMSALVAQQGPLINQIDFNVSTAADHIEVVKEELKEANVLNKKARKKQIAIAVIVVVLLVIIAIVIAVEVSKAQQ